MFCNVWKSNGSFFPKALLDCWKIIINPVDTSNDARKLCIKLPWAESNKGIITADQSGFGKNNKLMSIPINPAVTTIHPFVRDEYRPMKTGTIKPAATRSAIKNI